MISRLLRSEATYLFIFNLLLSFIVLITLVLRTHFTLDSYSVLYYTSDTFDTSTFLSRAGYTKTFVFEILLALDCNLVLDQKITYIIMIVLTAAAITIVARIFIHRAKGSSLIVILAIDIACVFLFINPFMMELMLFPECALSIALGSLLTALSLWFFSRQKISMLFLSTLMLILALGAYQAYLGVFFAAASLVVWLQTQESGVIKSFIFKWLRVFAVGLSAALFQIIFMKAHAALFATSNVYGTATLNFATILENIKKLILSQPFYFEWALGKNLEIPFYIMLVALILIMIFTLKTLAGKQWITFILAFSASYLCVFALHTVAEDLWVPFRSVFGLWAVLSCFLLLPPLLVHSFPHKNLEEDLPEKKYRYPATLTASITLTLFMFIAVYAVVTDISIDNLLSNKEDANIAQAIDEQLTEYEAETGIPVTTISRVADDLPIWTFPVIRYVPYESNSSALRAGWGIAPIINYYSGRHLEYADMDDTVYSKHFKDKDWDTLNLAEQLVIVDGHAYLCNY